MDIDCLRHVKNREIEKRREKTGDMIKKRDRQKNEDRELQKGNMKISIKNSALDKYMPKPTSYIINKLQKPMLVGPSGKEFGFS